MIVRETFFGTTLALRKSHHSMYLKIRDATDAYLFYLKENKVHFADILSRRTFFGDTVVPCGSEKSHIQV